MTDFVKVPASTTTGGGGSTVYYPDIWLNRDQISRVYVEEITATSWRVHIDTPTGGFSLPRDYSTQSDAQAAAQAIAVGQSDIVEVPLP